MTRALSRNPLRVSVVGCGQIADIHISEIQKIKDVRLTAVCDAMPLWLSRQKCVSALNGAYTDLESLLKEQCPDVVHITTPPASHLKLTKLALDHGATCLSRETVHRECPPRPKSLLLRCRCQARGVRGA